MCLNILYKFDFNHLWCVLDSRVGSPGCYSCTVTLIMINKGYAYIGEHGTWFCLSIDETSMRCTTVISYCVVGGGLFRPIENVHLTQYKNSQFIKLLINWDRAEKIRIHINRAMSLVLNMLIYPYYY